VCWLLECYGSNRGVGLLTLDEVHANMVALGTYQSCVATIACTFGHKDRCAVARAKRLKTVELSVELVGDMLDVTLYAPSATLLTLL
jgi:hypothetical protein